MEKIGRNINFRLTAQEKQDLAVYAHYMKITQSEVLRQIVREYTDRPEHITEALTQRVVRALVLREARDVEGRVQISLVMEEDSIEALRLLSNQTGLAIEGLMSLMVSGHMTRWKAEVDEQLGAPRSHVETLIDNHAELIRHNRELMAHNTKLIEHQKKLIDSGTNGQ